MEPSEAPGRKAPTFFAPGERVDMEELRPFAKRVIEEPIVRTILRSIPGSVLILNRERQILAANDEISTLFELGEGDTFLGLRPGELAECVNAKGAPSGCGTSKNCRACGAILAILAAAEKDEPIRSECSISVSRFNHPKCMNLSVFTLPVMVLGEKCVELVFHDISDKKMREALDRLFLHDLRNAMSGVMGYGEVLQATHRDQASDRLVKIAQTIADMIEEHSALINAESGQLNVNLELTPVERIISDLEAALSEALFARKGRLVTRVNAPGEKGDMICTDPVLLNRILVNMAKNGFEAIEPGDVVTLIYRRGADGSRTFEVHNTGLIPEDTQPRVFQRAFSTKGGVGRGFGTYGMKVIGEGYLDAAVGFDSTPCEGTTFHITFKPPTERS